MSEWSSISPHNPELAIPNRRDTAAFFFAAIQSKAANTCRLSRMFSRDNSRFLEYAAMI
jgi:hypothetical protein